MDLMKLQNLLNECIMIEQGNYLGGNLSVNLAEAQAELDQAKQLLIQRVSGSDLATCEKCGSFIFTADGKQCVGCGNYR